VITQTLFSSRPIAASCPVAFVAIHYRYLASRRRAN
jgi:hypothetical protein